MFYTNGFYLFIKVHRTNHALKYDSISNKKNININEAPLFLISELETTILSSQSFVSKEHTQLKFRKYQYSFAECVIYSTKDSDYIAS